MQQQMGLSDTIAGVRLLSATIAGVRVQVSRFICDGPQFVRWRKSHRKSRINKKWHKRYGAIFTTCPGKPFRRLLFDVSAFPPNPRNVAGILRRRVVRLQQRHVGVGPGRQRRVAFLEQRRVGTTIAYVRARVGAMSMPKTMQLKHISDLEILEAVQAFNEANRRDWRTSVTPEVALAGKYPEKLILRKMEVLDQRGFLDYGVSLRTAWLTDRGKAYLAKLQGAGHPTGRP